QMGQAELHADIEVLHVLAIGAEVVATQEAIELLAENVDEDIGTARRVDAEQREERRPEAPGPQALALVGVAGLIDVEDGLIGQGRQQFLVSGFEAGADLLYQLGQLAPADGDLHYVAQELADGGKGGVTNALEEADQGRQVRPGQAGLNHRFGQRRVMHLLALGAPVGVSAVLLNLDGNLLNLDLLHDARSFIGVLQRPAAVRAAVEDVIVGCGDLFRRERRAFVARMAWLAGATAFVLLVLAAVPRWLDNVTGRRLGRIAGVLACCRQLHFQPSNTSVLLSDALAKLLARRTSCRGG